jgi:hypothetical protein
MKAEISKAFSVRYKKYLCQIIKWSIHVYLDYSVPKRRLEKVFQGVQENKGW